MLLRKTPSPTVKKNFKVNENQNPELSNAEPIADKIDYKQSIQFSPLQNEHDENQSTFKFEMVPVPEGRQTPVSHNHITEMNEEESGLGSASVANTTDLLSRQLDKISSRKSSLAECTASTMPKDLTYLNKLTSAYHQANALRKNQSKSRSRTRNNGGLAITKGGTTVTPFAPIRQQSTILSSQHNINNRQTIAPRDTSKTPVKRDLTPQKKDKVPLSRPRTAVYFPKKASHLS